MASAWGLSWGSAWGNSWGSIATTEDFISGGKGDNGRDRGRQHVRLFKPTGLIDVRRVKDPQVAEIIEQSIQVAQEIAEQSRSEIYDAVLTPEQESRIVMSLGVLADGLMEIDLLNEQVSLIIQEAISRRKEDDAVIAILLAASI